MSKLLEEGMQPQNSSSGVVQKDGPSKSVKVVIKASSEVRDREEFSRELGLKCSQKGPEWLFMLKISALRSECT